MFDLWNYFGTTFRIEVYEYMQPTLCMHVRSPHLDQMWGPHTHTQGGQNKQPISMNFSFWVVSMATVEDAHFNLTSDHLSVSLKHLVSFSGGLVECANRI